MTPAEAAEGRRLLEAYRLAPAEEVALTDLDKWLWANREELVRCVELQSGYPDPLERKRPAVMGFVSLSEFEPQGAPTSLVREARASARLDGETYCLPDENSEQLHAPEQKRRDGHNQRQSDDKPPRRREP